MPAFISEMKEHSAWPFADRENGNIYSGGSHGGINEYVRECKAHVAFISPEATKQLDPQFPPKGVTNANAFVDMKVMLD